MGRWSRHPMGSDGALDARDAFMADFDTVDGVGNEVYYFERDKDDIRKCLLNLSLEDLEDMASRRYVNNNRFVIPYTFVEYRAYPKDPRIKEFLLKCLDSTADFDEYGNGQEAKHVQTFKDNFEDIITGVKVLTKDKGLIAAIEESIAHGKVGLVNKTKYN